MRERDSERIEEETDETVYMSLAKTLPLAATHYFMQTLGMDDMPLIHRIARDQLGRLRREGWTRQQQASVLFVLVQDRHCPEYIQRFPWLLADLGLELDVNLSPACLPAPVPVLTWLEAELWDLFMDWYEATAGAETEGLQRLRERPTMSNAEMEQWRTWATSGTADARGTRSRSRSPRREAGLTSAGDTGEQPGDETSLMHRGGRGNSWEDARRESRGRRRSRHRRRSRSRERHGAEGASNREARIRQRITGETRYLIPRCHDNGTSRWTAKSSPSGATGSHLDTTRRPVPSSVTSEMDLLEATGRWLRFTGLRREGEERREPSNALTRQAQADIRRELQTLGDRNLVVMTNALLRFMGMLYIEMTRALIQVHEDRRRVGDTGELVEVEIEADEESLYMQMQMNLLGQTSWSTLLQRLVRLADEGEGQAGLFRGLRRRIHQSLYLTSPRGAQLQAALVAITGEDATVEACDTEDNDAGLINEWWEELKGHMELGRQESAQEPAAPVDPGMLKVEGGHTGEEVEEWETERRAIEAERARLAREEEMQLQARAREEEAQNAADSELFAAHTAAQYRDWEQWVVLNTPTVPKRRRLLVQVREGLPQQTQQGDMVESTTVELPSGSGDYHVVMHVGYHRETVNNTEPPPPQVTEPGIDSAIYERAFSAWKAGELPDAMVKRLFGEEWLFLFGINKDGLPGDTLLEGPTNRALMDAHGPEQPVTTQLDDSERGMDKRRREDQWGQPLWGQGGVVDLGDSFSDEAELRPGQTLLGCDEAGGSGDTEGLEGRDGSEGDGVDDPSETDRQGDE